MHSIAALLKFEFCLRLNNDGKGEQIHTNHFDARKILCDWKETEFQLIV